MPDDAPRDAAAAEGLVADLLLTDDLIDWYIREFASQPDHAVYRLATEVRRLRRALQGDAGPADGEGE